MEQQLQPKDFKDYEYILDNISSQYAEFATPGGGGISAQEFHTRVSELVARLSNQTIKDNPDSIKTDAGTALANQDLPKAITLFEKELTIEETKHGSHSMLIIPTLSTLGNLYLSSGAYDKADQVLERSLKIAAGDKNYESQVLVGLQQDFANYCDFTGDHEKALPLRKQIVEFCKSAKRSSKETTINLSDALVHLGNEYQILGKTNDAAQCYQQALQIFRPNERNGIATVLNKRGLADLYFQLHRYKEAESLYRNFVDILQKDGLNVPGFMDVYLRQLGIIAQSNGEFEKSADYFKRADAISENSNGYDAALLAIDQSQNGPSLAQQYDDERLKTARVILA